MPAGGAGRPGPRRDGPKLDDLDRALIHARQLGEGDAELLATLQRDGRAGQGDLARATDWAPATVARRPADLRAGGALFFDVEVDAGLFGVTTRALLWMSVPPAQPARLVPLGFID